MATLTIKDLTASKELDGKAMADGDVLIGIPQRDAHPEQERQERDVQLHANTGNTTDRDRPLHAQGG